MMDYQVLFNGVLLLGLIVIDLILGSVGSFFQKEFDKVKFFQGIAKAFTVSLCACGVIYISSLTPDIIVINIAGQNTNLLTATQLLIFGGYGKYAVDVIVKLTGFINGKYKAEEIKSVDLNLK